MPTSDQGGVRGIAVTSDQSAYMIAGYSVIITGIFGFIWQFILYLILVIYPTEEWPRKSRPKLSKDGTQSESEEQLLEIRRRKANRYIALVAILNANDPWTAIGMLVKHAFAMCFAVGDRITGMFDVVIIMLALGVVASSIAGSVVIPAQLEMGTFAPANPLEVFFFATQDKGDMSAYTKMQLLRSAGAQKALGTVEAVKEQLRERVKVTGLPSTNPNEIKGIQYDYNISGVDFGLQHVSELVNRVQGHCTLEPSWVRTVSDNDHYYLFGEQAYIDVPPNPEKPLGALMYLPGTVGGSDAGGGYSYPNSLLRRNPLSATDTTSFAVIHKYSVVPYTVGRESYTPGTDPWYSTDPSPPNANGRYRVTNGKPPLSCEQTDSWTYKGEKINGLKSAPGLSSCLRDELFPSRFATPMIVDLAYSLGESILISSPYYVAGQFNADVSHLFDDMERLILASFVASRDILRDTLMTTARYNLPNMAREGMDGTGNPKPGVGDFVIQSGEVRTLSIKVLISIPCIWFFLWVLLRALKLTMSTKRNSGIASRFGLRATGLQAVHLYRLLDEEVTGYRDDWIERKWLIPYITSAKEPKIRDAEIVAVEMQQNIVSGKAFQDTVPTTDSPITPVADNPAPYRANPEYALFSAPKVVKGPDNRYHLKLTGPVNYEPKQQDKSQYRWPWKNNNHDPVANEPREDANCESFETLKLHCHLLTYSYRAQ